MNEEIISWKLDESIELIRKYQKDFKRIGYHLGLIGSVLNQGESYNDLDIVILPYSDTNDNIFQLDILLVSLGATKLNNENHGYEEVRIIYKSLDEQNRKIDWFIL